MSVRDIPQTSLFCCWLKPLVLFSVHTSPVDISVFSHKWGNVVIFTWISFHHLRCSFNPSKWTFTRACLLEKTTFWECYRYHHLFGFGMLSLDNFILNHNSWDEAKVEFRQTGLGSQANCAWADSCSQSYASDLTVSLTSMQIYTDTVMISSSHLSFWVFVVGYCIIQFFPWVQIYFEGIVYL